MQNPSHGLAFRYLKAMLCCKNYRMTYLKYISVTKKCISVTLFCGMRMVKPDKMVLKLFTVRQNTLISPICKTKEYLCSLNGQVRGPFLWETEHLFLVHQLVMDPEMSIFSWALTSPCTNTFRAMQNLIKQQKTFILWACLVHLGLQWD